MFVENAPVCVPGRVIDWLQLVGTLPPSLGPQNIVIVGAAAPMAVTAPWSVAVREVTAVAARLPTVALATRVVKLADGVAHESPPELLARTVK